MDNKDKSKLNSDELKALEEKLNLQTLVFNQTTLWWDKRVSILTNKIEKFNDSPEFDESIAAELEKERQHLNLKAQWERRQKEILDKNLKILAKQKEDNFFVKIAEKFSNPNIDIKNINPSSGKL